MPYLVVLSGQGLHAPVDLLQVGDLLLLGLFSPDGGGDPDQDQYDGRQIDQGQGRHQKKHAAQGPRQLRNGQSGIDDPLFPVHVNGGIGYDPADRGKIRIVPYIGIQDPCSLLLLPLQVQPGFQALQVQIGIGLFSVIEGVHADLADSMVHDNGQGSVLDDGIASLSDPDRQDDLLMDQTQVHGKDQVAGAPFHIHPSSDQHLVPAASRLILAQNGSVGRNLFRKGRRFLRPCPQGKEDFLSLSADTGGIESLLFLHQKGCGTGKVLRGCLFPLPQSRIQAQIDLFHLLGNILVQAPSYGPCHGQELALFGFDQVLSVSAVDPGIGQDHDSRKDHRRDHGDDPHFSSAPDISKLTGHAFSPSSILYPIPRTVFR